MNDTVDEGTTLAKYCEWGPKIREVAMLDQKNYMRLRTGYLTGLPSKKGLGSSTNHQHGSQLNEAPCLGLPFPHLSLLVPIFCCVPQKFLALRLRQAISEEQKL